MAVAVAIGVFGALLSTRSIVGAAGKAQSAAQAIAAGDLVRDIQVEGHDELSQMLQTMKSMQTALFDVVREVSTAASEVASNSRLIADSNTDLAKRTTRSATSLQNTAASVEQIASTLRGSSDMTRRAAGIAVTARQAASNGRGFAVVAAEVRALAQRLEGVAKEIKTLIEVSTLKIQNGTKLVNDAASLSVASSTR